MDYEKKYKEAIKRATQKWECGDMSREELEYIYPELADSEDEKIRKALLEHFITFNQEDNYLKNVPFSHVVAWIEKQGEQTSSWSEEDETIRNNISHIIRQYDKICKKENQPCWYVGDCLLWIQNIKDRVQSKQEWSEKDEQFLLVCKNALSKYQVSDKWDASIISQWLENRLKSHHSQKQWRPSKEQLNHLERVLRYYDEVNPSTTEVKKLLEQLKAL